MMEQRKTELKSDLEAISKEIDEQAFPEGRLVANKNGTGYKWFRVSTDEANSDSTRRQYLKKTEEDLARQLVYKMYLKRHKDAAEKEIHAIDAYLKRAPKRLPESLLYECPEYARLLSDRLIPADEEIRQWQAANYIMNPIFPDMRQIRTLRGERVRSKSETMIADALYRNNIPYRYECRLDIDYPDVYPDFTILHPKDRRILIWEHFGRMDEEEYINKYHIKMRTFVANGYIPSINLLTTFETKNDRFESVTVDWMLKQYFL